MTHRAGYVLVYLGFGYGVLSMIWFLRRIGVSTPTPVRCPPAELVLALGAGGAVGSLALDWIEGWTPSGGFVVQSAWIALDPLSTGAIAVLAVATITLVVRRDRGGDDRSWVLVSLGLCIAALVAGNVMIQATTTRGSHLRYGAYMGAWFAAVTAVGVLWTAWFAVRAERTG